MIWYAAKVFHQVEDQSDPDESNWAQAVTAPGVGNPVTRWSARIRSRVHAYDMEALTSLVGVFSPISLPDGWTLLSLADAQSLFAASVGRAPTDKEIF